MTASLEISSWSLSVPVRVSGVQLHNKHVARCPSHINFAGRAHKRGSTMFAVFHWPTRRCVDGVTSAV